MTIPALDTEAARVVLAGHVDHGKSTLIGRLLYELGALHQSKIDDVVASSARRGVAPEWSYVLDSLQEERDQAVTIDTTRLWFTHAGRRYVIIDAPGHKQFLANMLSGASEADAAILVVDAARGIEEQTRRHAFLLGFLGIRHVIVALNKIDLVDDVEARYRALGAEIGTILAVPPAAIIPVSASRGDNVARRADAMDWYHGPTVAEALEMVRRIPPRVDRPFRFAVQDVYRRDGTRVAVGTVAAGSVARGAALRMVPSHETVRAERLVRWPEGDVERAAAGESIGIVLDGDRFIERGDALTDPIEPPVVARDVALELFWLDAVAPAHGERLRVKRGTQDVAGLVDAPPRIIDLESAGRDDAAPAQHNVVRLALHAAAPLVFDRRDDDAPGSRTVVLRGDRVVAIGFVVDRLAVTAEDAGAVTLREREKRAGHRAAVFWLTGLSAAGKSTLAREAERRLFDHGYAVTVVDGDTLRGTVNSDLGFSDRERGESVRRAGAVADLLAETGQVVIVALISPFAHDRAAVQARARHPFYEVYVNAPLATCEERDPKGLYERARAGLVAGFTGIDSPYEAPAQPDLELRTDLASVQETVERLVAFIRERVG